MLGSSPFCTPFPTSCAPRFIGFTNSNQWFPEEGGEKLASEIKGMKLDFIRGAHAVCNLSLCGIFLVILDFIRGVYAVYFRWQNDLRHIIVWFDVFYAVKCRKSFYASLSTTPTFLIILQTTSSISMANYSPLSSERGWGWGFICLSLFYILLSITPRLQLFHLATRYELFFW